MKWPTSNRLAGLGFEVAAAVAGFTLFGYWIGSHYGRATLGLLVGAGLGVLGGTYNLIRAALSVSGEQQKKAPRTRPKN